MSATTRARRSDSLYHGAVSRRALCDLVAWHEEERADLRVLVGLMYDSLRGCKPDKELEAVRARMKSLDMKVGNGGSDG